MKKFETEYTNNIGETIKYPIYLIVRDDGTFDLQCDIEIYAIAWYTIYEESIKAYKQGTLKEINS